MNKRDLIRNYRRMLIIVVCLLPAFLLLDNFMGEGIGNPEKIAIFVVIALLVVALVF